MNIPDILLRKAVSEIWRNPHGDEQAIFRAVRLTPTYGVRNILNLPFSKIELPSTDVNYAVYEIGNRVATSIGVDLNIDWWVPFKTVMDADQILIYAFVAGRMLHLDDCYIRKDETGNIVIAVTYEPNRLLLDLNLPLHLRFYSNIATVGGVLVPADKVTVDSYTYSSDSYGDYLSFLSNLISLDKSGFVFLYKNGTFIGHTVPAFATLTTGDILEYVNDPMILHSETFNIATLDSFESSRDGRKKLIVSMLGSEYIYADDTELYLTGTTTEGVKIGQYIPKLYPSTLRHLTYKDLSVDFTVLEAAMVELSALPEAGTGLGNFQLEIYYRDNKQVRRMLLDGNRTADLMNLPVVIRKQALTGMLAGNSDWHANTLESSPYNTWLSSEYPYLLLENLPRVYSLYSAVNAIESLYQRPGETEWRLPPAVSNGGGTLMMLDSDGYTPRNVVYNGSNHSAEIVPDAKGYEIFYPAVGAGFPIDTVVNASNPLDTIVEDGFGILCYYRDGKELLIAVNGRDYTLEDGKNQTAIKWSATMIGKDRYVRLAQRSVRWSKTFQLHEIYAGFDVYNGTPIANDVGMGHLYVWVNGRYMIETLDYYLLDSKIYLCSNREDLLDGSSLVVVYTGLPDIGLEHKTVSKWGWVRHGKVSVDDTYDLYSNRDRMFFADGRAIPEADITGDEGLLDLQGLGDIKDGSPYAIVPTVQFSRPEDYKDLIDTISNEQSLDKRHSDWLSIVYPQNQDTGLITITSKYDLVSILMDRVIVAIKSGRLQITRVEYSETAIFEMLAPWRHLLSIDPTQFDHDLDYVEIHPRWIDDITKVTVQEFNFLNDVNKLALNGQVLGLNTYLQITT